MKFMEHIGSRREIQYIVIGFALSMVHWVLCFLFFAGLLFFLRQGMAGCVKGLLLITTRGVLSTAISCPITGLVQLEKWALIFVFSLAIFYFQKDTPPSHTVSHLKVCLFVFVLYNVIIALFVSTYPITSAFKSVSYAVPFYATVVAVSTTARRMDWGYYLYRLLTPIILLSGVAFTADRFNYVSGDFQGAVNHPNLFGVLGALFLVVTLYTMTHHRDGKNKGRFLLVCLTFFMIYESASRTGMFSAVIALVIYLATLPGKTKRNLLVVGLAALYVVCALSAFCPAVFDGLSAEVTEFVYKRNSDDILDSRAVQIDTFEGKFAASPLFGTGFVVPFIPRYTNYQLNFSLPYEAGNLVLAVLGDCGIIGSLLFWGYLLYIFRHTPHSRWVLFFVPIILSFGEMAFFATNNIAIYYYFLYGICLSQSDEEESAYEIEYHRSCLQRHPLSRTVR